VLVHIIQHLGLLWGNVMVAGPTYTYMLLLKVTADAVTHSSFFCVYNNRGLLFSCLLIYCWV
jgi:hypothetical protein